MPSPKDSWPPVISTQTAKWSSWPPKRSARPRTVATPEALSLAPGTGSATAASISATMATISADGGQQLDGGEHVALREKADEGADQQDQQGGHERDEGADRPLDPAAEHGQPLLNAAGEDHAPARGVEVGDEHQLAVAVLPSGEKTFWEARRPVRRRSGRNRPLASPKADRVASRTSAEADGRG